MRRHLDRRLKLSHLRTINALDRHGSLLKASIPLGVSQPAVTRTLHEAEAILGSLLFERLPRGVRPTAVGRVLASTAARVIAELQRLEEDLDQLDDGLAGTVTIGTLPVAASGVLPGALQRLRHIAPGVRVRLEQGRTEDLLPLLASGAIDLVVGRLYMLPLPDGFRRETLWEEPIAVLARAEHPIFDGRLVTWDELREHELVLPTVGQRVGQEIEHALNLLGLEPSNALRSNSPGFIREMLYGTDLLAVMPQLMMAGDLLRGSLRVVPLPVELPHRAAGLVLPHERLLSGATRAFISALRDHLASMADAGLMSITKADRF